MIGLIIAIMVMIADQASKAVIYGYLAQGHGMLTVTSFFNLVTAWNTGVSFSMFNNLGHYGVYILSGFAIIVVVFLSYLLYKEKSRLMQVALGCVIGGALGNVVDRVRLGAVFDFLDFHFGEHHWPAFNLADSFICIGAILIIFGSACTISYEKKNNQDKGSK